MSKTNLNRSDLNVNIGLYITKSRRVVLDADIGHACTWIKCSSAGTVVYQDKAGGGDAEVWQLEAGEVAPIVFDRILTSATIDGSTETTTATGLIWGSSPSQISNPTQ
jgi:hypothetical protein